MESFKNAAELYTDFTHTLLSHLPTVRKVDICMLTHEADCDDLWDFDIVRDMCALIENDRLDLVRFVYHESGYRAPDSDWRLDFLLGPIPMSLEGLEYMTEFGSRLDREAYWAKREEIRKMPPRFVAACEQWSRSDQSATGSSWPWPWSETVWALRRPQVEE